MYALYAVAAATTLCLSLGKFRELLHPQVLLTLMLLYMFFVDLLVRSEVHGELEAIAQDNLWLYQSGILLVYLAIWTLSFVHSAIRQSEQSLRDSGRLVNTGADRLATFTIIAHLITGLELVKRLHFSDWSIATLIELSLAPRGLVPWAYAMGNIGDSNFIYQIVTILLPLSGMIYGYRIVLASAVARPLWIAAFGLVLALLVAEGSRTPVYLVILTLIVCIWQFTTTKVVSKLIVTGALLSLLGVVGAVMYDFRSVGLELLFTEAGEATEWTLYHQDDNYYRALKSLHVATTTPERWSDIQFFGTVAANPIPRFFWPEKPILLQDFWGNYKNEWVTITFLGELVAMYGAVIGLMLSVLTGLLVYFVLRWASKLVSRPGGIVVNFLMVLYGYMVFRSLFNITGFAYLPLFAYVALMMSAYPPGHWIGKQRTRLATTKPSN